MSKKVACLGWLVPGLPPVIPRTLPSRVSRALYPPRDSLLALLSFREIRKHAKHTSEHTIKHHATISTSNNISIHTFTQACEHNFI